MINVLLFFFFFFFKQKTAYEITVRDWSSDVCSSDLLDHQRFWRRIAGNEWVRGRRPLQQPDDAARIAVLGDRDGEFDATLPAPKRPVDQLLGDQFTIRHDDFGAVVPTDDARADPDVFYYP